jgi:hypothetical protein
MPSLVQDREAQKRAIGEYLKAADRFIKSTEFPKALEEVKKALSVEPNNMYALAYNERIKVAMEAARKKEEEERFKKIAEEQKKTTSATGSKTPEAPPRAANAPDAKPQAVPSQAPPLPSTQVPGDDMITKIKKEAQEAAEKKSDARIEMLKQEFSTSQQKFQEDVAHLAAQAKDAIAAKEEAEKKLAALQSQLGNERTVMPSGETKERALALLAKLIQKAWADGVISSDERGLLMVMKDEVGLSDQEFAKMGEENRSSSYIAHLREVWKDGLITPEEAEKLESLRKTLNISAEEHFKIEAQVRKEMQEKK